MDKDISWKYPFRESLLYPVFGRSDSRSILCGEHNRGCQIVSIKGYKAILFKAFSEIRVVFQREGSYN